MPASRMPTELPPGAAFAGAVSYLVMIISMIIGFIAIGGVHLYFGTMALLIAAVSMVVGSLWVLAGLLHSRPHIRH